MKLPTFFSEIFQDTDGGASSKRVAFFVFILFFIGVSVAVLFHGISPDLVGFANGVTDKTQDIIKWLGGFILADKAPAALRAFTGGDQGTRTVTTTESVTPPTGG